MRACAADLREKARQYGVVLKAETPRIARNPVVLLLAYLQSRTGNAREHLGTILEILNAAYSLYGIGKSATTDALEKMLVRHVLPRLKRG